MKRRIVRNELIYLSRLSNYQDIPKNWTLILICGNFLVSFFLSGFILEIENIKWIRNATFLSYLGVSDQYMSNQIFHVIGQCVFIVVISHPTYMEMKKKYGKASYVMLFAIWLTFKASKMELKHSQFHLKIIPCVCKQRKTRWLYLIYWKLPYDKVV